MYFPVFFVAHDLYIMEYMLPGAYEGKKLLYLHIHVPYPREREPTTECRHTSHFGLNFLLRSSVYSNMHPCVAALESAAQMHEIAVLYGPTYFSVK